MDQPHWRGQAEARAVIDAIKTQDINTLIDWRLAELKMQLARSGQ